MRTKRAQIDGNSILINVTDRLTNYWLFKLANGFPDRLTSNFLKHLVSPIFCK